MAVLHAVLYSTVRLVDEIHRESFGKYTGSNLGIHSFSTHEREQSYE
jgi:hypothetical protein